MQGRKIECLTIGRCVGTIKLYTHFSIPGTFSALEVDVDPGFFSAILPVQKRTHPFAPSYTRVSNAKNYFRCRIIFGEPT